MSPLPPPPSPRLHIIVVEDETLIAQELSDTLLDLSYHVLATCYSYVEARQAFAETSPTSCCSISTCAVPTPPTTA